MNSKKAWRLLAIAGSAILFSGCATKGMYDWGNYDAMLYQSYKNPEKSVEFRTGLEKHIALMEQGNQKVAPGLYAELGTMYFHAGDSAKATVMYAKERNAWPESKGLMDALIQTVGKQTKTQAKTEASL